LACSINLSWCNGDYWRKDPPVKVSDLIDDFFEYKFIVKDATCNTVQQWQVGSNVVFDLKKLVLTLKELNIPSLLDSEGASPLLSIDRRTKIKLESSNSYRTGDILIIFSRFEV
jgi:hypothetical protein